MKITAPHLGNVYLAAKTLFDGLEVEYIMPPFNNKEALEIGSLHSPEEMCLPFKIMIGNYIQAIEKGANTVILPGSCGPCRFGEYGEMQINLLNKLGYNLEFILLDFPKDIGIKELFHRINRISGGSNKRNHQKIRALLDAIKVINLIDEIEAKAHYLAGYEKINGQCKSLLNNCKRDALKCKSPKEMINLLEDYKNNINSIEIDKNKNPIKIAIIGEIYTVIEPFSNLYFEDKLMDYGITTSRGLTPSWWVKNTALVPTKLNSLDIKRGAKEYLNLGIGGHARECIGEAVLAYEGGFDGAIQIFPMGCMPEIVSKAILPTISKDKDFPIMSLVVDEMTGEAGFVTRIEAFVDLLERRKKDALSWS
ncbi:CoA protein activase [Tissierella sp.]|uniref:CoA protein activase n=1 Tax=Tissierella sp. TaxID=41274 RepID=UPI00302DADF4